MDKIAFCAKPPVYFHEDMPITRDCIEKGKKILEEATKDIEHTPFDGLIENPTKAVIAVEHTPFDGLIEKQESADGAVICEAYKAATAPYNVPKDVSSIAAEDGYNEFRAF